jgi:sn-glycerol 3-phosphate transport system permease protein
MAERPAATTYDTATGWRAVGRYTLLVGVSVLVLFPVYTTVVAALKPGNKVLVHPLVPESLTLDVLRDAWTEGHLGRFLVNSLIVATVVTVAQLVTSVLSAYAFAMLEFPGRTLLFGVFLATLLVPLEATMVVNRRTIDSLGWLNTYQGLSVPFLAVALGTFLLRQVFMTLPRDLRDAAEIDGVGHLGFLRHVAVPLVRPTIGAMALLSFLGAFNQYLWPNLITTESDMYTVQSGLRQLAQTELDRPNLVMAGVLIAAIPIVIVLLLFQRQLVRGLTAGAVKG